MTQRRSVLESSTPVRDWVRSIVMLGIFLVPLLLAAHLGNSDNAAESTPAKSGRPSPALAESNNEWLTGPSDEEDGSWELQEAELRARNAEREAADARAAQQDAEAAQQDAEALAKELEERHRDAEFDSLLCQGGYYNPDC